MKNFILTLFETARDRIKNPFISAFIFSWIAFNWKPIFYLFKSDSKIENTINYIDNNFLEITNQLWLPIAFAIFYVLIIPYLMLLFDWLSKRAIIERKRNIKGLQIFDLKSKQELAEQESILENIKANYKEKADLNKKIKELQNQILVKDRELTEFQEKNNELSQTVGFLESMSNKKPDTPLTEDEKESLTNEYIDFRDSDSFQYFDVIGTGISEKNKIPSRLDRLIIEKYIYGDLITEIRDNEMKEVRHEFTRKGKFFWKEYITRLRLDSSKKYLKDDAPF